MMGGQNWGREPSRVVGLMSGTSLDGIDAAGLITDGERVVARGPARTFPYEASLRAALRRLLEAAPSLAANDPWVADVAARLTTAHADAVRALDWPADLIGFHGQTILHAPAQRRTWQIGDAQALAAALNTPVACDFRLADVAVGGQGAPLVPIYHAALVAGLAPPVAVLNIGGVANVTLVMAHAGLVACDTGPGNALLDDFCLMITGEPMDRDGRLAASGTPDEAVLARLLAHVFFAKPAPKSLDRQAFATSLAAVQGLTPGDAAATLAAFTARAAAATPLPMAPTRVLVCGGGRHNPAIMAALRAAYPVAVDPVEAIGLNGDTLEAECFAYLAMRVARDLPISFPATTGVPFAMSGGRIVMP